MSPSKPDWLAVRRPGSPILFLVCMLTILLTAIPIAHSSCEYNQRTRQGLNDAAVFFDQQAQRATARMRIDPPRLAALDLKAARAAQRAADQLAVKRLDCSLPFPPIR